MTSKGFYRIKTLASAGGVSPTLVRAWERRYGFFKPKRGENHHRYYTEDDLAVVRRIRELLDSGLAIGEIAALGRGALLRNQETLWEEDRSALPRQTVLSPALREQLLELAPLNLQIRRPDRFGGESLSVLLSELHPKDITILCRLYECVKAVYDIWTYMEQTVDRVILSNRLAPLATEELRAQLHHLGTSTTSQSPLVSSALKDCSWGALPFLLRAAGNSGLRAYSNGQLQLLVSLARDHAKMMRNAFSDLDPAFQEADASFKAHPVQPILTKMAFLGHSLRAFEVGSNFQGFITSRCLETSALDRILYHFLHRTAQRKSADSGLWVVDLGNGLSRWVFTYNGKEDMEWLPADLPVQAVALAVGATPTECLQQLYLGTLQRYGITWSWFHWPVYAPEPGTPSCKCDPLGQLHPLTKAF